MFIQLEYYGCEIGFCNVIFDTTAQSVLLANEEDGFFRLYFFTSDLVDLLSGNGLDFLDCRTIFIA